MPRPLVHVVERDPTTGLPKVVLWNDQLFEAPDLDEVRMWVFDSVCESLLGHTVEPDGVDFEGSPSWLLVMGLI